MLVSHLIHFLRGDGGIPIRRRVFEVVTAFNRPLSSQFWTALYTAVYWDASMMAALVKALGISMKLG
jgi:hypothetical protein